MAGAITKWKKTTKKRKQFARRFSRQLIIFTSLCIFHFPIIFLPAREGSIGVAMR